MYYRSGTALIKFHILFMICEFCYIFSENDLKESVMYRMFFLGGNFVSILMCTLKSKKPKNL